jgi:hypothetical protein
MENLRTIADSREIIKTVPYPGRMNSALIAEWADGIPVYSENDPENPEWRETPVKILDLENDGYGLVHIKDESARDSNPTGTIKDRAAWELAVLYRNFARMLFLQVRKGLLTKAEMEKMPVPRFTYLTAGNNGRAVEACFGKYNLPPPKIIFDREKAEQLLPHLAGWRADVYSVDMTEELSASDLLALTDNENGIDITSFTPFNPHLVFYDWHVHEVFNREPDFIFVPYGSGRLMENYLAWQYVTSRNSASGERDPRLKTDAAKVTRMNICGAEPAHLHSIADKLTTRFKPFLLFKDEDIRGSRNMSFTGSMSGKEPVEERYIAAAHTLLKKNGFHAEPSAAAGLALYLRYFDEGRIGERDKVVVVNTGEGVY